MCFKIYYRITSKTCLTKGETPARESERDALTDEPIVGNYERVNKMPKFNKGDHVIHKVMGLAIIEDVHFYLPKSDGTKKKIIWYSVRVDGMRAIYAISQKTGSLRKAKGK